MPKITTDYELERIVADDYEYIALEVEFTITAGRDAVLYGDYPSPAEDPEVEIQSVKSALTNEVFALTDDEEKALYQWIDDQDWSDEFGPDPDWQRDNRIDVIEESK